MQNAWSCKEKVVDEEEVGIEIREIIEREMRKEEMECNKCLKYAKQAEICAATAAELVASVVGGEDGCFVSLGYCTTGSLHS